jgi:hypothetical protein
MQNPQTRSYVIPRHETAVERADRKRRKRKRRRRSTCRKRRRRWST